MTLLRNHVLPHTYLDSIVLMEIACLMEETAGVEQAAAVMGTKPGLDFLRDARLMNPKPEIIRGDDLILAVSANDELTAGKAIDVALQFIQNASWRRAPSGAAKGMSGSAPAEQRISWGKLPNQARLAVISVPGPYAAAEAWKALRSNHHVLIFSDHVSIEDEISLKQEGARRDLLVMGPECGTAIINGVPLGFGNLIQRGSIGIVAASGSGLQELACLIDRLGGGISHAIGTGGRDLSLRVNGLTAQMGLSLLQKDPSTKVIVLLSKPPHPQVAQRMLAEISKIDRPSVVCFIGGGIAAPPGSPVKVETTIEDAAWRACELAGIHLPEHLTIPIPPIVGNVGESKRVLRGLFSGGTLAYEAMAILRNILGPVYSNTPLAPEYRLHEGLPSTAHICLDLGAEEYTSCRPHPMIDGRWRSELIAEAGEDPNIGVILFDVILGTGSDVDPARSLLPGIMRAKSSAAEQNRHLDFVASVSGTHRDPQSYHHQVAQLQQAEVLVTPSNAEAARLAALLVLKNIQSIYNTPESLMT